MSVLIDTNVLLRRLELAHPHHAAAFRSVDRLLLGGEPTWVTLQILTEAWRVMTSPPAANGLGWSTAASATATADIRRMFPVLSENAPAIADEWQRLVARHQVMGLAVFDARLAATMIAHKVDNILTFNTRDFARYGVGVLHPSAVR